MAVQGTYLVCPLNWGLGHATRLIPIIHRLLKDNNKVIIGGDGEALQILRREFPKLAWVNIPDLQLNLRKGFNVRTLLIIATSVIMNSIKEHAFLKSLIKELNIDVIISDNRYGLWNSSIKSIFVTHQLMLKLPRPFKTFEGIVHLLIKKAISKFDECWVPDTDTVDNLSGDLSHKYPLSSNTKFIRPLSRFTETKGSVVTRSYDCVVVLSGPEPQRTYLQNEIVSALSQGVLTCLVVEGRPSVNCDNITVGTNIEIVPHLETGVLKTHLLNAKLIICRSGYSSIMDLNALDKKAIIIPTIGQTEQEYLAVHLKQKHFCTSIKDLRETITITVSRILARG